MHLSNRVDKLENLIQVKIQAPTIPIYDNEDLPENAVTGQIAIGSDASFNWYDGTNWQTRAGVPSTVGNIPQDVVLGQIVIGTDGSFHWCFGEVWYTAQFQDSLDGNTPQDVVLGQIVIGTDGSFHWYDGIWHTFA